MPENDWETVTHNNGHPADADVMQQDADLSYSTRSEEVQEIMGRMPSWIIRWGMTLMTVIIAGILMGAYLFKYPDIIPAGVTISSSSPPVKLIARNNLPIQTLLVQNNQEVQQGDVLCVFANPAKYPDVIHVMQLIARIDTAKDRSAACAVLNRPASVNVGELQPAYVALFQAVQAIRRQTGKNNFQEKIRAAAKQFNGAYAQWEQKYVLRTPVSGKVSFFKYWKENQFVQAGEAVMTITPPVRQYVVRGNVSLAGAGKIKQGQKVLIKLLAYPYEEFGSLSGVVAWRSSVATDSTFSIEIHLENGLHTNTNKDIAPQPQMEGTAEIVIENKSLLQRLFENAYSKQKR